MTQQVMSTQNPMLAMGVRGQLERAAALDGRSLDARDALVDYYSMAPAMMGGGADKARAQAQAISKLDAMRGHFTFGRLAVRSKDSTAVEREMNAAIALGQMLDHQSKSAEARAAYQRALELDPRNEGARKAMK